MPKPRLLYLSRFRDPSAEALSAIALSVLTTMGDTTIVNKASDDPQSPRYWLSIVHRLLYAVDAVVLSTHRASGNVIWGEQDALLKGLYRTTPYDQVAMSLGAGEHGVIETCRPALLFVDIGPDEGSLKQSTKQLSSTVARLLIGRSASIDEQRVQIRTALETVLNARRIRLDVLTRDHGELVRLYNYLGEAIVSDPEIQSAVTQCGETPSTNPPEVVWKLYRGAAEAALASRAYGLIDVMLRGISAAVDAPEYGLADVLRFRRELAEATDAFDESMAPTSSDGPQPLKLRSLVWAFVAFVGAMHLARRLGGPRSTAAMLDSQLTIAGAGKRVASFFREQLGPIGATKLSPVPATLQTMRTDATTSRYEAARQFAKNVERVSDFFKKSIEQTSNDDATKTDADEHSGAPAPTEESIRKSPTDDEETSLHLEVLGALAIGEPSAAFDQVLGALRVYKQANIGRRGIAAAQVCLARIANRAGDSSRALALAGDALEEFRRLDSHIGQLFALREIIVTPEVLRNQTTQIAAMVMAAAEADAFGHPFGAEALQKFRKGPGYERILAAARPLVASVVDVERDSLTRRGIDPYSPLAQRSSPGAA